MQEEREKEKTLHLTTALLKIMKKMQPNDLIQRTSIKLTISPRQQSPTINKVKLILLTCQHAILSPFIIVHACMFF